MAETGVGRIIDNKYEILTSIGRGGMSYVWLGRDKRLDKMWAIKEFRPSTISSQGAANRQAIIDEANFIKRLDHPAIPRVVDIIDTGSSIFVVMDFVDGTALNKVLRQQQAPFEQERVIEWGIQLCDVLEYLHGLENPVVYRDMKPSNIMLRGDDSVKLIDFGISMELLPSGPSDTRVIGTGGYGAPEQVDKDVHRIVPVDTRADIYALGATLYSLVTNHVPRAHKDETGKSVVDFEMRPIRDWDGQLSEGLEHIIEKATQKDPADRYDSAAQMRYDLEHYEELTQEYRAVQQKKVKGFRNRLVAAGVALAVGIACMVTSFLMRNSSYDALVHEASVADTSEKNAELHTDTHMRTADVSDAEDLYVRAIEVDPGRIDTYFTLVELYEEDSLFTTSEEQRWTKVWQAHGRNIENDARYGELCFDVGKLYLVFYDFMDAHSFSQADSSEAATGMGAAENATRSMYWFKLAKDHPESLSQDELNEVDRYEAIGDFYEKVTKANRTGDRIDETYLALWNNLSEMILGEDREHNKAVPIYESTQDSSVAPEIVQLRVYQVAFECVNSNTYLKSFKAAGITREEADALLTGTCDATRALSSFVNDSEKAAGGMYDEIINGEAEARANIGRVYNDPLELAESASGSEEA